MKNNGFSRRNFLKTGALTSLLAGAGSLSAYSEPVAKSGVWQGKAKNVIFMVSDGMSAGTLALADLMTRHLHGRSSHWISMYERDLGRRGLMDMASASSTVTDSAAAVSSWGCGKRVMNRSLNTGPQGEAHPTVWQCMKAAGKAIGLVTTTRMTHATPAGFLVNMPHRNDEDAIAAQYLERGADVFYGGGARHFDAAHRSDGRNLFGAFAAKGYRVVRNKVEFEALPNDQQSVLGIFFNDHLPYAVDHVHVDEYKKTVPTLAELTRSALARLSKKPNGFALQVEGGRVDHAAHANDAAGLVFDQMAFDDAVGVALDFVDRHPDTLLIVTSDHGNANPGLNGDGRDYNDSAKMMGSLASVTRSFEWMGANMPKDATVAQIRDFVAAYTNYPITPEQAEYIHKAQQRTYRAIYRKMHSTSAVMGQVLANYTAVNFIGDAHTGDYVELFATGPGSASVAGFVRNTNLFDLMLQASGVPAMRG